MQIINELGRVGDEENNAKMQQQQTTELQWEFDWRLSAKLIPFMFLLFKIMKIF